MNNKIPLKQFAEVFSKELNISQSEAEAFIKQVFAAISSELVAGNQVTVNGIGTFSISSTSPEPVEFIPDESLAEEINAPFSIFTPVVLEEGVTEEELAEVSTPEISGISEESEESEESEISEVSEISENSENSEDSEEAEEAGEAEVVEAAEVAEPVATPEQPVREWEDEEEEYVEQPQEQNSKFGTGFVIGLIVGLAIGALVLCAYILYFVNASPSDDSIETEHVETLISPGAMSTDV